MKQIVTILLLCAACFGATAQNNVFVLVDVSKSVKQQELTDAKQALTEVLTGVQPSKAFVAQGKQQDLANFKVTTGDKLAIASFGSLRTSLQINPTPTAIQNVSADVSKVVNSISWSPTDMQTYVTLAKAKIAEYAKNNGITNYRLYIISDNINDDYGPNGRPNYTDDYTRDLVDGYNTSTNPVKEAGYTKLKFKPQSDFTLSFSPQVDVSAYAPPTKPNAPTPLPPADATAIIKISSSTGKKNKEAELKNENVSVSWTCANCPTGIIYTAAVSQYDGGKYKETKKNLTANSVSFKLPNGKFRITVSASNYAANSDTAYIKVSTGGFGWLLIVLLLLVAGGVGYYFWNKSRQEKAETTSGGSTHNGDIFNNGGNTTSPMTNTSSNSDYF
jgi:hypothetical protein